MAENEEKNDLIFDENVLDCISTAFSIGKYSLGMTASPKYCDICQNSAFFQEALHNILNLKKGWLLNLCIVCQDKLLLPKLQQINNNRKRKKPVS